MKKVLFLAFASIFIVPLSIFAYTPTTQETIFVEKLSQKINAEITIKGEATRTKFMNLLFTLVDYYTDKPGKEGIVYMFNGILNNIMGEDIRAKTHDLHILSDMNQLATVLMSYSIDHGSYPSFTGGLTNINTNIGIQTDIMNAGMSSIPSHPLGKGYYYQCLKIRSVDCLGFVLVGEVEKNERTNFIAKDFQDLQNKINTNTIEQLKSLMVDGYLEKNATLLKNMKKYQIFLGGN